MIEADIFVNLGANGAESDLSIGYFSFYLGLLLGQAMLQILLAIFDRSINTTLKKTERLPTKIAGVEERVRQWLATRDRLVQRLAAILKTCENDAHIYASYINSCRMALRNSIDDVQLVTALLDLVYYSHEQLLNSGVLESHVGNENLQQLLLDLRVLVQQENSHTILTKWWHKSWFLYTQGQQNRLRKTLKKTFDSNQELQSLTQFYHDVGHLEALTATVFNALKQRCQRFSNRANPAHIIDLAVTIIESQPRGGDGEITQRCDVLCAILFAQRNKVIQALYGRKQWAALTSILLVGIRHDGSVLAETQQQILTHQKVVAFLRANDGETLIQFMTLPGMPQAPLLVALDEKAIALKLINYAQHNQKMSVFSERTFLDLLQQTRTPALAKTLLERCPLPADENGHQLALLVAIARLSSKTILMSPKAAQLMHTLFIQLKHNPGHMNLMVKLTDDIRLTPWVIVTQLAYLRHLVAAAAMVLITPAERQRLLNYFHKMTDLTRRYYQDLTQNNPREAAKIEMVVHQHLSEIKQVAREASPDNPFQLVSLTPLCALPGLLGWRGILLAHVVAANFPEPVIRELLCVDALGYTAYSDQDTTTVQSVKSILNAIACFAQIYRDVINHPDRDLVSLNQLKWRVETILSRSGPHGTRMPVFQILRRFIQNNLIQPWFRQTVIESFSALDKSGLLRHEPNDFIVVNGLKRVLNCIHTAERLVATFDALSQHKIMNQSLQALKSVQQWFHQPPPPAKSPLSAIWNRLNWGADRMAFILDGANIFQAESRREMALIYSVFAQLQQLRTQRNYLLEQFPIALVATLERGVRSGQALWHSDLGSSVTRLMGTLPTLTSVVNFTADIRMLSDPACQAIDRPTYLATMGTVDEAEKLSFTRRFIQDCRYVIQHYQRQRGAAEGVFPVGIKWAAKFSDAILDFSDTLVALGQMISKMQAPESSAGRRTTPLPAMTYTQFLMDFKSRYDNVSHNLTLLPTILQKVRDIWARFSSADRTIPTAYIAQGEAFLHALQVGLHRGLGELYIATVMAEINLGLQPKTLVNSMGPPIQRLHQILAQVSDTCDLPPPDWYDFPYPTLCFDRISKQWQKTKYFLKTVEKDLSAQQARIEHMRQLSWEDFLRNGYDQLGAAQDAFWPSIPVPRDTVPATPLSLILTQLQNALGEYWLRERKALWLSQSQTQLARSQAEQSRYRWQVQYWQQSAALYFPERIRNLTYSADFQPSSERDAHFLPPRVLLKQIRFWRQSSQQSARLLLNRNLSRQLSAPLSQNDLGILPAFKRSQRMLVHLEQLLLCLSSHQFDSSNVTVDAIASGAVLLTDFIRDYWRRPKETLLVLIGCRVLGSHFETERNLRHLLLLTKDLVRPAGRFFNEAGRRIRHEWPTSIDFATNCAPTMAPEDDEIDRMTRVIFSRFNHRLKMHLVQLSRYVSSMTLVCHEYELKAGIQPGGLSQPFLSLAEWLRTVAVKNLVELPINYPYPRQARQRFAIEVKLDHLKHRFESAQQTRAMKHFNARYHLQQKRAFQGYFKRHIERVDNQQMDVCALATQLIEQELEICQYLNKALALIQAQLVERSWKLLPSYQLAAVQEIRAIMLRNYQWLRQQQQQLNTRLAEGHSPASPVMTSESQQQLITDCNQVVSVLQGKDPSFSLLLLQEWWTQTITVRPYYHYQVFRPVGAILGFFSYLCSLCLWYLAIIPQHPGQGTNQALFNQLGLSNALQPAATEPEQFLGELVWASPT